ncbi:Uncharacterised protein [Escherichia coli]|nr:Uncharacterised protein [Escherichia coli]
MLSGKDLGRAIEQAINKKNRIGIRQIKGGGRTPL